MAPVELKHIRSHERVFFELQIRLHSFSKNTYMQNTPAHTLKKTLVPRF